MTQKEYREKLKEYEDTIVKLREELRVERNKNYSYEGVLSNYHEVSEELRRERESNRLNCNTINNQRMLIDQYEKILGRITISEGWLYGTRRSEKNIDGFARISRLS